MAPKLPSVPALADYGSAVPARAAAGGSVNPPAFGAGLGSNASGGAAAATVALTTSGAVPSGGHVVVGIGWYNVQTVTLAGGGLSWTQDGTFQHTSAPERRVAIFSAPAPSGLASSTVLTATYSGTVFARSIGGLYLTGVASSYLDAIGGDDGTDTWAAPVTTTNAKDLIVGYGWVDVSTNPNTPGGGFTEVLDFLNAADSNSIAMIYRIVTATGTYTATSTSLGGVPVAVGVAVAYKGA